MEAYLERIRRSLKRAKHHVAQYEQQGLDTLSVHGRQSYGYFLGRVSILEDAVDEIEKHLKGEVICNINQ